MSSSANEANNEKPTFWSRLVKAITWSLANAIRLLILIILISVVVLAVWAGLQELDRSLNSIATRVNINQHNLEAVRNDVDNLSAARQEARLRLDEAEAQLATVQRQLTALQEESDRRLEMIASLEERLDAAMAANEAQDEELAAVGDALAALQQDINDNSGQIDQIGGQLDAFQTQLADLNEEVMISQALFTAPDQEMAELRQAVALFHIWELLSRAQLRLMEGNLGLAAADVQVALAAVDLFAAAAPAELAQPLSVIQARLTLAADNLPDNPSAAASDLAIAWETLDPLLADLLWSGDLLELEAEALLEEEAAPEAEEAADAEDEEDETADEE